MQRKCLLDGTWGKTILIRFKLSNFDVILQYCSSDCGYLSLRTQVLNAPSHFQVVNPRKTYGPAADMCSLGCTVLEMLTRQIPYPNVEWVCHISTSLVLILWYLTCRILKKICCAVIVHSIKKRILKLSCRKIAIPYMSLY
jgi:serine/threonine protein kinase